jgi:cation/acetate symporter
MTSELYQRIRSNPKYQDLVRRRGRLAWSLALTTLGLFFAFILVAALSPGLLATPVIGITNLAVLIGALMPVYLWIVTGIYIRLTSQDYDKITEQIAREANQ